ncbi:beta-1,3-galactosyl-O-glycosyl-glycoprotein beta-1,6-N-acetylglucosaminyltransferase 7 [Notolabrus celidotus]|uniref:beta-1,3-galactosyl-O-glycosyl-glycoprotein beta-1,6-N-acetylglucosaminyltransferase 7 n=1 Tax=Notolabrus celidotus TaxID=1203425 RepID=UPI00149034DC|nr:beta-1,3-galactosyl-O-glycosyl-glycoprotein beta-1,6-N-acetylglucosaminyltransferase 7 [Notolabrus celidotus]XP_034540847.1 beta-1,3-galactosyl-O-glycosyl-glycoprotein beta-1,6-N-acetylglucosaminyltransferase 7 [Notolabrus celidotus]XP_034540852.1 beta-1,3-galactosyl-O-glycosyl-glycoprotein beta-1,6-N-acetylglucosaminyltransferase 7 [Notolabrus celidotus]
MCQLDGTKCSFLVCLGMSIVICSVIYLRTRMPMEPKPQEPPSCRPFSSACKAFLPGIRRGLKWHRRDCQVESLVLDSGLQCSALIRDLHFITTPLSREEEDYPLAYILTIHKELGLFVRLLRAIYTPQNVYCIHVDAKAPLEYKQAVKRIVSCFKNTFLSSRSETVTYAGFSRLQADLNCMADLAESKIGWRKVVNLCGQDFPIMTNLELVRYMQSKEWRDRNMTPGVKQPMHMRYRTQLQHSEITGSHVALKGHGLKKGPPPRKLQVYFGTAYYALTRAFVYFVLKSPIASDLLEWSKDTFSPDEHYWVTLNHVKEAPGSHIDGGWAGDIRAIKWRDQEGRAHNGCKGRYVRDICIYGLEDLPWIINKKSMFANKFESNTFPEALDCLEQWHRNKVLSQATVPIDLSWPLATRINSSRNYFNSSAGA